MALFIFQQEDRGNEGKVISSPSALKTGNENMLFSSLREINSHFNKYNLRRLLSPLLFSHYSEVKCSLYGQMVLFYIKETISNKTAYQHLYVSEIEIPKLLGQHYYYNSVVCFW